MECRSEHHTYTGMFRAMLLRCDFLILLFRCSVLPRSSGGGGGGGRQALRQGGGRNVRDY